MAQEINVFIEERPRYRDFTNTPTFDRSKNETSHFLHSTLGCWVFKTNTSHANVFYLKTSPMRALSCETLTFDIGRPISAD